MAHRAEDLDRGLVGLPLLLAREGAHDERVHQEVEEAEARHRDADHHEARGHREGERAPLALVTQDLVGHLPRDERVEHGLGLAREPLGDVERRVLGGVGADLIGAHEPEGVPRGVVPGRDGGTVERV